MKKYFSAIILALFLPITALAGYFPDVPSTNTYYQAINELQDSDIISGYSDGTYKPDAQINRAEFSKIVLNTYRYNVDDYVPTNCFPDVKSTDWFAKYICMAKDKGFIEGYPDGTFKPNNNINVAEALKIVIFSNPREQDFSPSGFENPWYLPYINYAKIGNFWLESAWKNPSQLITRGETAFIVWKNYKDFRSESLHKTDPCISYINIAKNRPTNDQFYQDFTYYGIGYSETLNACVSIYRTYDPSYKAYFNFYNEIDKTLALDLRTEYPTKSDALLFYNKARIGIIILPDGNLEYDNQEYSPSDTNLW